MYKQKSPAQKDIQQERGTPMLRQKREELALLCAQQRRKEHINTLLNNLRREEQRLVKKEQSLRKQLSKEEADVKRLEKTSLAAAFYTMLGQKEDRLEKEQREALAAKLTYDVALHELEDCQKQIAALQQEETALSGCEQHCRQVYDEVLLLLKDDPAYGNRLCHMEQQLGKAASQLQEVEEAIAAGNACMDKIKHIEESLNSAEGWGFFDLLGGGLLSDIAKHSRLDEAQYSAEELQSLLNRFRTELADVIIDAQLKQMNINGLLSFADYFFDGIITDWCVLSRISDSQKSVAQVKKQVSAALSQLQSISAIRRQEKADIEQQIAALAHGR